MLLPPPRPPKQSTRHQLPLEAQRGARQSTPHPYTAHCHLPSHELTAGDSLASALLRPPYLQLLPCIFAPHCAAVPLATMVRGTMEWLLDEESLERLFHQHAPQQYTRELTIAALVDLLIQVSTGARRSVHAAYKADVSSPSPTITTSPQALYTKLGRLHPALSETLVRFSADKLGQLLALMPVATPEPLPGYRLRILDGNVLAGSDHRLKALRQWAAACLPGKSLVVYEPARGLVTDLVLCEDAYTQERALLVQILPRVHEHDLWVADRNFCTTRFVFGVAARKGRFVVRQHRANLVWESLGKLKQCGQTDSGTVWEQRVRVTDPDSGEQLILRRVELRLFQKTRDGERTIVVLTNLSQDISAVHIAMIYRQRWTVEQQFQFLTQSLHCELTGLGQPRAALFGFAMALVASNVLAVERGALRTAHGREREAEVSGYYLADEVAGDYRTLMKYLPPEQWVVWRNLKATEMVQLLIGIAREVRLSGLSRNRRGPKKTQTQKKMIDKRHKHRSTARLLQEAKVNDTC
jgi:IS4 transposase